jgi:tRNA pseudouridine38-40 synthase
MRIALGLEYDGRGFCGWQSQASRCGVQDALEHALERVAGCAVRTVSAGRTDTGVHATAQVAHFDSPVERPMNAWVRGTNASLPAGVSVLWAHPVADAFHARYCATARAYTYLLLNRPVRAGLEHGRVGWFHRPLDLDAMRAASQLLTGTHDFSAFRAAECTARTPVRRLDEIAITRHGEVIVLRFKANAFLQHMVRNLVGSLVYVGKGKYPPAWVADVLASRDRGRCAPTFAPDGLYLTAIEYDKAWNLPATERDPTLPPGSTPCARA